MVLWHKLWSLMRKQTLFFLSGLFSALSLFGNTDQKVNAYYQIKDYASALSLLSNQESFQSTFRLQLLSKLGMTQEALKYMKEIPGIFDVKKQENFLTLESLAWSILLKHVQQSETTTGFALLGAYMTKDAKAAELLMQHLYSSNSRLRAQAANFAAHYQDTILKEAVIARFKVEKNYEVQMQLIESMGKMHIKEALPLLDEVFNQPKLTDEMRGQALLSYSEILESLSGQGITYFFGHQRAYFKQLACRLALSIETISPEVIHEVEKLVLDAQPEVQKEALVCLGILSFEQKNHPSILEKLENLKNHPNPLVALLSCWTKARLTGKIDPLFEQFLDSSQSKIRYHTVSLIGALGPFAEQTLKKALSHEDAYVRVNAALGLLKIRKHVKLSVEVLEETLNDKKLFMMMDNSLHPNFSVIIPSLIRHHPFIPAYPKVVDSMVRLKILEAMMIFKPELVKPHLRELLKEKDSMVTFYTIAFQLQEDLESFEFLKELENDEDPKVALSSTLAIAFVGKDNDVVTKLIKLFSEVGFEDKIHILEAIGHLGDRSAIPFLLETMQRPFTLMQIVAASSLIQCLYH